MGFSEKNNRVGTGSAIACDNSKNLMEKNYG
jgi:hypothetical protein